MFSSSEAGYAFAKGKKVIVVDIVENINQVFTTSLMVENGRYATIRGLHGLRDYDWDHMMKYRSDHEQK